ncbi:MAG: YceI family protein [Actinomycetes bacterium]
MTTDIKTLTGNYAIDPSHSQIGFSARHVMVTKVRGQFNEFTGTGFFDVETPANSKIDITIQVASINTRNADRDAHLRTNDFFAAEEFPTITFKSTSVAKSSDTTYAITGDLTIKTTTKSITFDLDYTGESIDPWGNQRIGLEGSTSINRSEYGVEWNTALETGGVLVSEKVSLEFEISAVKSAE